MKRPRDPKLDEKVEHAVRLARHGLAEAPPYGNRVSLVCRIVAQTWHPPNPKALLERMSGPGRSPRLAEPRSIAMAIMHEMLLMTQSQIGEHFDRDHTTVLHALRKYQALVSRIIAETADD